MTTIQVALIYGCRQATLNKFSPLLLVVVYLFHHRHRHRHHYHAVSSEPIGRSVLLLLLLSLASDACLQTCKPNGKRQMKAKSNRIRLTVVVLCCVASCRIIPIQRNPIWSWLFVIFEPVQVRIRNCWVRREVDQKQTCAFGRPIGEVPSSFAHLGTSRVTVEG